MNFQLMTINLECCLHFWSNNQTTAQYLLNNNIDSRESIKDLGIMITSDPVLVYVLIATWLHLGPINNLV